MSKSTPANILWLLLAALLLSACATTSARMDSLDRTLKDYDRAIRWGQFDAVYAFRKWGDEQRPVASKSLQNLRVTQYKVLSSDLSPDKLKYTQVVKIHYYLLDSPRERQVTDRQKWEYDEEQKRWWLTSEIPAFLLATD